MGLKNLFKKQLASVIEWKDQNPDLLFWKYPAITDEIKNTSKLIVAPGQGCIFVYEGEIVNVITEEGVHNLKTSNHPFVTTLIKFWQNFTSEHTAQLYYFKKSEALQQNWGTSSPIKYMDPYYKIPVQLGVCGNYSYKIIDSKKLFTKYVGSQNQYRTKDFQDVIQSRIPQIMTSFFAEKKLAYLEIDASLTEIAKYLNIKLQEEFNVFGVQLTDFRIEGTNYDEDTLERISKVANITTDKMAADEVGMAYEDLEKLKALRDAAQNESGIAGIGMLLRSGDKLGEMFEDKVDKELSKENDPIIQIQKLKHLFDENIITEEEFNQKKKELLGLI